MEANDMVTLAIQATPKGATGRDEWNRLWKILKELNVREPSKMMPNGAYWHIPLEHADSVGRQIRSACKGRPMRIVLSFPGDKDLIPTTAQLAARE